MVVRSEDVFREAEKIFDPQNMMKRGIVVGRGNLRRPAAKRESRHKQIRISCYSSESWIIVLETNFCHFLCCHVIQVCVFAKVVLVSPFLDDSQELS